MEGILNFIFNQNPLQTGINVGRSVANAITPKKTQLLSPIPEKDIVKNKPASSSQGLYPAGTKTTAPVSPSYPSSGGGSSSTGYTDTSVADSAPEVDPVQAILQSAMDLWTNRFNEYNAKVKEFDEKNPFNFDQVLVEEKAKATQRFDPYYNQTLGDFITGIERKRSRSIEDERTILKETQADVDYYQGREGINLQNALEQSREGFADSGLYGSGKQLRAGGQLEEESGSRIDNFMAGTEKRIDRTKQLRTRLEEDLTLEEKLKRRDLEKEKEYNVESAGLSGRLERQQQREFERQQYTGAPPGVDPLSYNNNTYGLFT